MLVDRRTLRISDCRRVAVAAVAVAAAAAAAAAAVVDNIAGHETVCSWSAIDYSYLQPRWILIID